MSYSATRYSSSKSGDQKLTHKQVQQLITQLDRQRRNQDILPSKMHQQAQLEQSYSVKFDG